MVLAYLGLVIAAWGGLLAVNPNDSASWVGGAAALTLLTIAIGFNARNQIQQSRAIKDGERKRRQDHRVCNYQLSILVDLLTEHGVNVPGRFYDIPDDETLEQSEQESRRRSRRMFGFINEDEDGKATAVLIGTVAAILALFLVFTIGIKSVVIDPLNDVAQGGKVDRCVASLTADYFVAIERALAAPPAPNPERAAAAKDLITTAERIRNRVTICSDGAPDSYKPAPVP